MATPSNYQRANRQISLLSQKLANNLTFRKAFLDALTAAPAVRMAQMRSTLTTNGITYPFRLSFTPGTTNPRVQIWAPVTDPANKISTRVGYTYRVFG